MEIQKISVYPDQFPRTPPRWESQTSAGDGNVLREAEIVFPRNLIFTKIIQLQKINFGIAKL